MSSEQDIQNVDVLMSTLTNQETKMEEADDDPFARGVSNLWTGVNHIAIVVADVGRSLAFYADVVGMKQVIRPNFDRHGAWLTMGNVDLHLIKGRPAVHEDDDLIVSHIAISVNNMKKLRDRLQEMGVLSRKNVSVPNPADNDSGVLDQAFVRDPDGYYIEFANCTTLENYIHQKTTEVEQTWDLNTTQSVLKASKKIKKIASESKMSIMTKKIPLKQRDSNDSESHMGSSIEVDHAKLANLIKRRKIYGDIAQNATEEELEELLVLYENQVPSVIAALEDKVRSKGTRTYIPPAFYGRDGSFVQPPSFEMSIDVEKFICQPKEK